MNGYSRADEIATGIRGIAARCGIQHSGCGESPVFVFSAGQGSGAGELANSFAAAFAMASDAVFPPRLVDSLARQLLATGFTEATRDESGSAALLVGHETRGIDDVIRSQVRLYRDICTGFARRNGVEQWGMLQYDLSAEYAVYLQFLFPAARFLFVRRNLPQSFRSFLAQQPTALHHNEDVAASFQRHCTEVSTGFERWHNEVGGLLVDYDNLLTGDAERVEDFLGVAISDEVRAKWRSTQCPLGPPSEAPPAIARDTPPDMTPNEANAKQRALVVPRRSAEPVADSGTKSCAVLVPTSRYIEPECDESLRALERRGYVIRRLYGCAAIDAARNTLATRALDEGFEETLWVDSDVAFDADAVEQLRSHNLPIVCGVYAKKGPREVAAGLLPGTSEVIFGEGGGLTEVLYAGLGFVHVRRHVYEAIRDKLRLPTCNAWTERRAIPFFMPMIEQWGDRFTYLAEDYGFCRRARQCGFKIYADTSIRLWHIGSYRYGYEDASAEIARVKTHRYTPRGV